MKEIPSDIKPVKFVDLDVDYALANEKLSVGSFGIQGSGKSRFGATLPSPIGVVALDRKTRYSIAKTAKELGKRIIMPEDDFIRVTNPMKLAMMKKEAAQVYYRDHINRIKQAAFTMAEMPDSKCKSIIIDSGSQLAEDMLFACYGRKDRIMPRDRGEFNQEMIDFLNAISTKHTLITHKARQVWVNDQPTDKIELKGFGDIGYYVNVEVQHYRAENRLKKGKKPDANGPDFLLDVIRCQANAGLHGEEGLAALQDEAITFQNLAMLVYPDSEYEDWE